MDIIEELNPISDHLEALPQLLYKYRTFDEDGHGIELASTGEAFFASARDFGDIFECYLIPVSQIADLKGDDLKEYIHQKIMQHYPDADSKTFQEMEQIALDRVPLIRQQATEVRDDLIEVQYNNIGILSLTETCSSLPMWAYYAANHSGLCIGLRTEVIGTHQTNLCKQSELLMLHRVDYSQDIPQVSVDISPGGMSSDQINEMERTFYTKSLDWQHEGEVRLIFQNYSGRSYSFGPEVVGEVIIGARTDKRDIEKLLGRLHEIGSTAKVRQAYRSKDYYGLSFKDLTV